jgi:hypothetical protein
MTIAFKRYFSPDYVMTAADLSTGSAKRQGAVFRPRCLSGIHPGAGYPSAKLQFGVKPE